MSLFSEFETSASDEANGVEFSYTNRFGEVVFKVRLARAGGANTKFEQVQEREMAPLRRTKNIAPSLREKVYRRVFAEACALPGTWQFKERLGMKVGDNTCNIVKDEQGVATKELKWEPETPKNRTADGFIKGIEQRNGAVVPDTVDNVAATFEQLPELFLMLFQEATSRDAFRVEEIEEDSKN